LGAHVYRFGRVQSSQPPFEAQALKQFLQGKVHQVDLRNDVFLDAFADAGETEAMVLYKQLSADK